MKSRHGRAILSIREDEIASESVGVQTTYYKTFAFVLSAMLAGIAGCLYAGYLGSLYPSTFKFMKSIEILVMVVLGGMGSMLGSILSATGADHPAGAAAFVLGLPHGRLLAGAGRDDDLPSEGTARQLRFLAVPQP